MGRGWGEHGMDNLGTNGYEYYIHRWIFSGRRFEGFIGLWRLITSDGHFSLQLGPFYS